MDSPLPPSSDAVFHAAGSNGQFGPVALDTVLDEIIAGRLDESCLVWWPGAPNWVTFRDNSELVSRLQARRGGGATWGAQQQPGQPWGGPPQASEPSGAGAATGDVPGGQSWGAPAAQTWDSPAESAGTGAAAGTAAGAAGEAGAAASGGDNAELKAKVDAVEAAAADLQAKIADLRQALGD